MFPGAVRNYKENAFINVLSEVLRGQAKRAFGRRHEPDLRGIFELVMGNTCCVDSKRLIDGFGSSVQQGASVNAGDESLSYNVLETFHQELIDDDEEHLLDRLHTAWSPTKNAMETLPVRSFIEPRPDTPLFLAVEGARILMRQ
ncbi:hypothetical protein B0H10DRAFT_2218500 [Mycena sp. CBHHK59/15]|nr:hypothetical protein B0H10DRAFT_2218500 [Mycena sp. CBHHK59/15]